MLKFDKNIELLTFITPVASPKTAEEPSFEVVTVILLYMLVKVLVPVATPIKPPVRLAPFTLVFVIVTLSTLELDILPAKAPVPDVVEALKEESIICTFEILEFFKLFANILFCPDTTILSNNRFFISAPSNSLNNVLFKFFIANPLPSIVPVNLFFIKALDDTLYSKKFKSLVNTILASGLFLIISRNLFSSISLIF